MSMWRSFVQANKELLGQYEGRGELKITCVCENDRWKVDDATGEFFQTIKLRTTIFRDEIEKRIRVAENQHKADYLRWLKKEGTQLVLDFLAEKKAAPVSQPNGDVFVSKADCEIKMSMALQKRFEDALADLRHATTKKWDFGKNAPHNFRVKDEDIVGEVVKK